METKIHIGKIIREHLKKEGRTQKWLADKVNLEDGNFRKKLKNNTVDIELLLKISDILKKDFFAYYSNVVKINHEIAQKET